MSINLLRSTIRGILLESSPGALEGHILSFYEAVDMPVSELRDVFTAALGGSLESIQEKMDGQALTFTVKNGVVEGFSKGVSWERVQRGGNTIEMYRTTYADRPTVQYSYVSSMEALQQAVDRDPALTDRLFQDGKVVIETAMLVPTNPNTIPYLKQHIRFIRAEALAPDAQVDQVAYQKFLDLASSTLEQSGTDIQVGSVPILKPKAGDQSAVGIDMLNRMLDQLLGELGLNDNSRILDIIMALVARRLKKDGYPDSAAELVSRRLVSRWVVDEYRTLIPDAPDANVLKRAGLWDAVSKIEKTTPYVDESIIPLERIIQKLGHLLFQNLEFVLASNDTADGEALRRLVRDVDEMFKSGKIMTDDKKSESIRVALARIGDNVDLFEKAVEGVVFRWKGQLRKITGMFTAINKLRGFFAYGTDPALRQVLDQRPTSKNTTNESRKRWLNNNTIWVV